MSELRPFYPLTGSTTFAGNNNNLIEFEIPKNSVQFLKPNESYLTFDVTLPAPSATAPPLSLNILNGAHSLIRQVEVLVNNVAIDRVDHYNILTRRLAGSTSTDELPTSSALTAMGSLEPPQFSTGVPSTPGGPSTAFNSYQVSEQITKAVRPAHLFYIQTFATSIISAVTPRKARFCLYFASGFMSAVKPFYNTDTIKIRITLESNARVIYDFPTHGLGLAGAYTYTAGPPASAYIQTSAQVSASQLCELFPPGSAITFTGATTHTHTVTSLTQLATGAVELIVSIPTSPSVIAGDPGTITPNYSDSVFASTALPTVDNVILYVNKMFVPDGEVAKQIVEASKQYSFMSSYEALLNILNAQASPTLNYGIIPTSKAVRMLLLLEDVSGGVYNFPQNSLCCCDNNPQTSATNYTGLDSLQFRIGSDTVPLQTLSLSKWCPSQLTEMLRSYYEAGGESLQNAKVHSIETLQIDRSYANMSANLTTLFNRFMALSLIDPTFLAIPRDLRNELVQVTFSGTSSHSMIAHMFVDHIRTITADASGSVSVAY